MKYLLKKIFFLTLAIVFVFGCKKEVLPKPSSQLRLEYPLDQYVAFNSNCPYFFEMNTEARIIEKGNCSFEIHYPKMKATVYLSYKPVINNINILLKDAQKLTYEHVIKADDILEQPFLNRKDKVYGMFYDVDGNAATNAQFYVTDSTKNFVNCSVYFYAKPNFDSIMPAVSYIKNDMKTLMESLRWK